MPTVWEKIYTLRYGTAKSLFGRSLIAYDMDNFINKEIADDNKDKFTYGLMSDDDILINNMHFKI